MKKFLLSIALCIILAAPAAHAQSNSTQPLPQPATDQGPVIQISGQSGNGCQAGAPVGNECYSCPSGYTLSPGSTPLCNPPTTSTSTPTTVNSGNSNSSTGFVPLAPIPGLDDNLGGSASASNLAGFLNNLYKYLIGLAAILAVIMIIWGGIEYATQDSISSKSNSRHRIEQALLGLVLVLAPALVFTIINPSILNLSLNLPVIQVAPNTPLPTATPCTGTSCGTTNNNGQFTTNTQLIPCSGGSCTNAQTQCQNEYSGQSGGYTLSENVVCVNSGGTVDPNGRTDSSLNAFSNYSCASGETLAVNCGLSGSGSGSGSYIGH